MPFDLKKFQKAKFEPRTETVKVASLASFFGEDDPVFTVRGLTGEELARVNAAQSKAKSLNALVEALAGQDQHEKVKAIRDGMGLSEDDIPEDLARRIEMMVHGCVSPSLDAQAAAKLFRVAPVDGYAISNTITALSGKGMILGEPRSSGKTTTSKVPSTSDTPEEKCSTNSAPTDSPTAT